MIIHSSECFDSSACLLLGIPQGRCVLYSVGWDRSGWDRGGMGQDGVSVGVDFLIQEHWMLFVLLPLMAAAFYCLPLCEGNL